MSNDITVQITATHVAWYGAIVATLGMAIALVNSWRDRARIKIQYKRNAQIVGLPQHYDPQKTYFNVTVINKGRRPVNITKAGFGVVGKEAPIALLSDSFSPLRNKVLTEENPTSEFFVEQDEDLLRHATYIFTVDGTGREYRRYLRLSPVLWRVWVTLTDKMTR